MKPAATSESQTDRPSEGLREYARRLVADWPPLTADQRTRLSVLLRPEPSTDIGTAATRQPRQDVAA